MNFQWCKLKLHLLPLVIQEIDLVADEYITNIKLLYSKSDKGNYELYQRYKQQIENRITELEDFYEINFGEENIECFEVARIRLKKLLMFEYTLSEKEKQQSQEVKSINKESNELPMNEKQKLLSRRDNESINNNNNNVNNNYTNTYSNNMNNASFFSQSIQTLDKSRTLNANANENPLSDKSKIILNNQSSFNEVLSSTKPWSEVSFRLILTAEEYKYLMKEKGSKVSFSS